jgi:hypothetical protein
MARLICSNTSNASRILTPCGFISDMPQPVGERNRFLDAIPRGTGAAIE